jgi:periplasmic protein TonB
MLSRIIFDSALHEGPATPFGERAQRFRGAFGASLLSHAAFFGIIYLLMTLPATVKPLAEQSQKALAGLVFLNQPGPAGGGGGGGNRTPEPARHLETRGADQLAVPIMKAPPLTPPQQMDTPHDPPPMALVMPVKVMDAGQFPAAGVLEDANKAPTASQGPGSNGGAGTGRDGGSGPGDGPGEGPGRFGGKGGDVYTNGAAGVVSPILVREVKPAYTPDAMRARIQGEVWVSAVVLPDGSVGSLRVIRSLDRSFGLDEQAIAAVRQWKFKPGTRAGQPVAVQIDVSVGFSMR